MVIFMALQGVTNNCSIATLFMVCWGKFGMVPYDICSELFIVLDTPNSAKHAEHKMIQSQMFRLEMPKAVGIIAL